MQCQPAREARLGPGLSSPRPMVLPTCPMAEFALPRHSAVMERLRRRIELCRRHHSTCEARYEAVSPERLELERQHTFALHQRCIQAKAKRAGKHRQPPAAAPAPAPAPAPAAAPRLDAADGPEHGLPVAVSRTRGAARSPDAAPDAAQGALRLPQCPQRLGSRSGEANMAGAQRLSSAGNGTVALPWQTGSRGPTVRPRQGRLVTGRWKSLLPDLISKF